MTKEYADTGIVETKKRVKDTDQWRNIAASTNITVLGLEEEAEAEYGFILKKRVFLGADPLIVRGHVARTEHSFIAHGEGIRVEFSHASELAEVFAKRLILNQAKEKLASIFLVELDLKNIERFDEPVDVDGILSITVWLSWQKFLESEYCIDLQSRIIDEVERIFKIPVVIDLQPID